MQPSVQRTVVPRKPQSSDPDDNLIEFIDLLQAINTESPKAALNATTIDDNNGGRIEL